MPPGRSFRVRELEQPQQVARRQVLHELRGEDAAQGAVLQALEVRESVGLLHVEPLAARERDHVGVGVDAAGVDAGGAQKLEELAAPAPRSSTGARSRKSST